MTDSRNVLKAVSESPYELVVENHIILFGGRDLTGLAYGENKNGTLGEYFTKSTELESDYTKTGRLYVDFEHGQDPDAIGNNPNSVLGFVDWKTAKVTDNGVIVKRVLNRRHRYMRWLEPLIKAGLVGNSSQAVDGQTKKSVDGEIEKWPLVRDSLTVTPMEFRMTDQNIISAVKSMTEDIPQFKSLIKMETKKMDETIDVKAAVSEAVKAALAERDAQTKAEADAQAAIKAAEEAGYQKALEEIKTRKAPAFNKITTPGFSEEKDAVPAFKHWVATGEKNGGLISPDGSFGSIPDAKAAWNVTTGASGAYLVPDPLYNRIIAKRDNRSWVRQLPVQYFTTPSDHLLVSREDTSLTDFVQTAEAAAYDENEGTVSQKDLILYKYTKLTKLNEEFTMYQSTNWDEWFGDALGRAVASTENTIFTTGTGTGDPEGIVTGATVANTTASTDVILPAELAAFYGYLGNGYDVGGEVGMMMANTTKWYLAGQTGNPFLYQMTPAGTPDNIMGTPVVINDVLEPYTTASAKCIIRGNFNYYAVVEKPGMLVRRNEYLFMGTGQIGIYASIFRGGGVLQSEAFHYLTNHS